MSEEIDVLDATLDDLADLPEWKPFPVGVHKCVFKFETKKNDKKVTTTYVTLKALETVELANPTEDANLEPGAEVTVQYQLGNPVGQGKLKALLGTFAAHLGLPKETKLSAIIEAAQGTEALVSTRIQTNKDKTQRYTDIVEVAFM
jgi:hypothetical protein